MKAGKVEVNGVWRCHRNLANLQLQVGSDVLYQTSDGYGAMVGSARGFVNSQSMCTIYATMQQPRIDKAQKVGW